MLNLPKCKRCGAPAEYMERGVCTVCTDIDQNLRGVCEICGGVILFESYRHRGKVYQNLRCSRCGSYPVARER